MILYIVLEIKMIKVKHRKIKTYRKKATKEIRILTVIRPLSALREYILLASSGNKSNLFARTYIKNNEYIRNCGIVYYYFFIYIPTSVIKYDFVLLYRRIGRISQQTERAVLKLARRRHAN